MTTTETKANYDAQVASEYDPSLYSPKASVEPIDGLGSINDGLIEQYHELGFLAIDNVFSHQQVEAARAGMSELISGSHPQFHGVQLESFAKSDGKEREPINTEQRELAVRKLMRFVDYNSALRAMAEHQPLLDVVKRLMAGREPKLFQDMALSKPPGGREKPWHQDNAYFQLDPAEPVVGVWIALDQATIANGCMHLIPGTHREGPVVHFHRRDWQICDTQVRHDQAAVPLSPGGLLIFNGLLHHGTPTNHTNQRRRALQYHYAPADVREVDEHTKDHHFGSAGKDVTC